MPQDSWHQVSLFESHDYVRTWYETEHGKRPNAAKTTQVTSFFSQGREFFRNASRADMSVKPLLLYYGVLSLSRGVILLRDPTKKEESLQQSHGLKAVDWKRALKDGVSEVLSIAVEACDGTFRELAECCENKHQETCFRQPGNNIIVVDHDLGPITFSQDGSPLTLDNLLSRLMSTAHDYPSITGRPSMWFPARVTIQGSETHFAFLAWGDDSLSSLSENRTCEVGWTPHPLVPSGRTPVVPTLIFKHKPDNLHQNAFPVFHHKKDAVFMDVILDFPNGDKLSGFYKLYLVSYILGMLCRYFPSKWMSVLRGGPGDFAQPLLVKAVEAIEDDFPRELSRQVPGHPTVLT